MSELKPYPAYKDSGVEWIDKVPEEWAIIRIKNTLNSIKNGIWGKEKQQDENDINCIRIMDFDRSKARVKKQQFTIRNIPLEDQESFLLKSGDILIEKSGGGDKQPVGYAVLYDLDTPAVYTNFMAKLTVDKSIINQIYLGYVLEAIYNLRLNLKSIKQTTGIQNLDLESYLNEKIMLPPMIIQYKIATFLTEKSKVIDNVISKKESLIKLLEEQRQAIITETVTKGLDPNVRMKDSGIEWIGEIPEHWEIKKLKYIGQAIMGLLYSPRETTYKEQGTLVLRASNIQSSNIDLDREDNVYVNKEIPEELIIKVNDILICARSGSRDLIGKSALIDEESAGSSFGAFTTAFRSKYNNFLSYVFHSGLFQSQIGTYLTSTINQLTMSNLRNLEVVFPPKNEQDKIVVKLNRFNKAINESIKDLEIQIKKLKQYRESLIYEAVTGKIDLRDYDLNEDIPVDNQYVEVAESNESY